ncbi:initiator tRNA phosphoribosyl transferase [Sphaeroforma arctica JP610]|uniref:Initiator tRNA phosphoribosyl transferase n=1 Tax=Sphaeroforma arctica JP610 TaxID=667725 RepID=A0A0L0G157_9EUKA|nr:initiator tRNA phosphoribosyl transferase [Sphaeroforma arctica JP610]KNC82820.1 initiator tRNA phosphoribosyl transferase [Sphaeroforma arctica JP610]|eukprot:XP_014156722.1 initiator tRNA phosphoribosyl transferase [Sphaeroforma arctica JP610]
MASEQAYFKDLQNLRSERLSLFNRTRSIAKDSAFVSDVKASYGDLPLVANLRCGLWYSNSFDDHAYFKSTDGHSHMCDLNMRRLNLHLLKHLQTSGGFMLVDSSRRKRFPDSMSRTVPIWAACVNAVVDRYQHRQRQDMHKQFPEAKVDPETQLPFNLYVLPTMVSAMEKAQLESMMEQWLVKLERTLTESTSLR